ncbi:MAG: hypothetical protein GY796_11670 [Chloroflexi bacterium]|nr:hypothetical protein [Chloroflexota bacterium]
MFYAYVYVPASAADGISDTATITATSQMDAMAMDTADLTTTAATSSYEVFLPLIID